MVFDSLYKFRYLIPFPVFASTDLWSFAMLMFEMCINLDNLKNMISNIYLTVLLT